MEKASIIVEDKGRMSKSVRYESLAVLPVRGGSKGILRKNLQKIGRFNLLQLSAMQCFEEGIFDLIVISSEDEEILKTATKLGFAEVIKRPRNLASDESLSSDVVKHALFELRGKQATFQYVTMIEVTSPIRKKDDIGKVVRKLKENTERFDAAISVCAVKEFPGLQFYQQDSDKLKPFLEKSPTIFRRQDFETLYHPYGGVYSIKVETLEKENTFYPSNLAMVLLDREQAIEVDDYHDLLLARQLFEQFAKGVWYNRAD